MLTALACWRKENSFYPKVKQSVSGSSLKRWPSKTLYALGKSINSYYNHSLIVWFALKLIDKVYLLILKVTILLIHRESTWGNNNIYRNFRFELILLIKMNKKVYMYIHMSTNEQFPCYGKLFQLSCSWYTL